MNKVDELIQKLEAQKEQHQSASKEIDSLVDQQATYLKELLTEYKPVYEWYHNNHFIFTHPENNVRSPNGPILGFNKKDDTVIIYNIEARFPERIYLHDTDDKKYLSYKEIVKSGHFEDAVKGIRFLDTMLEQYIQQSVEHAHKLRGVLEKEIE